MGDRADRARERDLAEVDRVIGQNRPGERGDERRRRGEVGRGLGDPQAARDVEIDVVLAGLRPACDSSTASTMARRFGSQPTTARRAVP